MRTIFKRRSFFIIAFKLRVLHEHIDDDYMAVNIAIIRHTYIELDIY